MSSARKEVDALVKLIQDAAHKALDEYERHAELPTLGSLQSHPLDSAANTVDLKKIIRILEGGCDQLCSLLAPPAHTITNRAQESYWACLRVAAKVGIADVLGDDVSGVHVRDIAARLQIEENKITSVLRVLAARHCFREVKHNVFANNRLSQELLSTNAMSSFVDLLTNSPQIAALNLQAAFADPRYATSKDPSLSPFMYSMKDKGVDGLTVYDVLKSDPEKRKIMGRAMVAMNDVLGSLSIIQEFPWNKYSTICDVGSGVGSFAWSLLAQYPGISATLFDLPDTINIAQGIWAKDHANEVADGRVTFSGGSFFEDIPHRNLEIYYLRNIIHNWPDAQALTILRAVRRAMGPSSRVLIHDYVMRPLSAQSKESSFIMEEAPEPLLPSFGAGQIRLYNQDLTMMMLYNSKERTVEEVDSLGREADLQLVKIWDLGETAVLEFIPL